jgi:hypothetical protein
VAAVMALGALLRSYQIRNESPWWDEIVTLRHLDAPSLPAFISGVRQDDPPMTPGYFSVAYAWARAVSPSVTSMRLLSVLFSMAAFPLIFDLTRNLYGARAGVFAALAFALSMVQVYFAQEIRTYSFITFFALVSACTLTRALRGGGRLWWAAHLATNALLAFTHLFAMILFGVEGMLLLLFARSRPRAVPVWFVVHAVLGVSLALWLGSVDMSAIRGAAGWMVTPGWKEAVMAFVVFAGGRASNENPATHLPTGVSLDWALAALVYGVVAWFVAARMRDFRRTRNGRDLAPTIALLTGLIVPLGVLGVASYVWRPCFVYRYVLYSSLALYILFGAAVNALESRRWRVGVLIVFMTLSFHQLSAIAVGPLRPDWRGAGEYLAARVSPDDEIIVFQCFNRTALEFDATLPPGKTRCVEVWSEACDAVKAGFNSGGSVWFLVWLWTEPDKFEACFRLNNFGVETTDFKGWPNVRVYHLTRPSLAAADVTSFQHGDAGNTEGQK